MGLVVKLYDIVQKNRFSVYVKEGDSPYPFGSLDYELIRKYNSETTTIEIRDYPFKFNTQYWVKILDDVTHKFLIKNIHINDPIAFEECGANCDINFRAFLDDTENIVRLKLLSAGADTELFSVEYSNDNGTTYNSFNDITFLSKSQLFLGVIVDNKYTITTSTLIKITSNSACVNFVVVNPVLTTIILPPED